MGGMKKVVDTICKLNIPFHEKVLSAYFIINSPGADENGMFN
jgi:hypothetical protein